jgi:uncharacterized Zn ribbon protein
MILLDRSFKKIFISEVTEALQLQSNPGIVTEQDIKHLPEPVQKYLRFVGAVGKEKVHSVKLEFSGDFKTAPNRKYAKFTSVQYNFYVSPGRFFYMKMPMMGLTFEGLHVYKNEKATMKIRMASLITVVDARGEKMDQGETVTVFNDLCLMAPSALIDADIKWKTIDSHTIEAIYRNGGNTISATLYFNETGELINFISNDRFLCSDGKTYLNYPWSTPVKNYKDFNGRKVPTYGKTIWQMPEGVFVYGKFTLKSVAYNCKKITWS